MNKNTQSKYSNILKKISYNQTETYDRELRNEIVSEINRMNAERNGYEFSYSVGKKGIQVRRIVPSHYHDRKLYISGINKSQLTSALRANNWSKEGVAREFGISARSVGRMISKHGIVGKPAKASTKAAKTVKASAKKATTKKAR